MSIPEGFGAAPGKTPAKTEVEAVPAASVLVLRDAPLEVLMMRRPETSSFVPNAWVFPGGVAEGVDYEHAAGDLVSAMRATAIRETFEETRIRLDDELVFTSRWVTPLGLPKRYDTFFFLAKVTRDVEAIADTSEAAELVWITPEEALARAKSGAMQMVFPTLKNLEALRGFESVDELLDARRGADVPIIRPILVVDGKQKKLVIPDPQ
jgi:8-oxo-dGTP pyrophosphatase MutT (NUDIX family)